MTKLRGFLKRFRNFLVCLRKSTKSIENILDELKRYDKNNKLYKPNESTN